METVNVKSNDISMIVKEVRLVAKELHDLNRWLKSQQRQSGETKDNEEN